MPQRKPPPKVQRLPLPQFILRDIDSHIILMHLRLRRHAQFWFAPAFTNSRRVHCRMRYSPIPEAKSNDKTTKVTSTNRTSTSKNSRIS
jgi:hypothetical protein